MMTKKKSLLFFNLVNFLIIILHSVVGDDVVDGRSWNNKNSIIPNLSNNSLVAVPSSFFFSSLIERTSSSSPSSSSPPPPRRPQQRELQTDDDDEVSGGGDENNNNNNNEDNNDDSQSSPPLQPPQPLLPEHKKPLKICSVLGGLDITRLRSTEARKLFRDTIDDVELIREYFSEAIYYGGSNTETGNLEWLKQTLDYEARNLPLGQEQDTLSAGLGYSDDRLSRRIDRMTSNSTNLPFVGTKQSDSSMMSVFSNILPWIVDRKKSEKGWTISHQNGRTEAPEMEPLVFDSLYQTGYVLSWADSIHLYPPLSQYGHPLQVADVMGGSLNSHTFVVGAGFLPDENPNQLSAFFGPYADVANAGSLITATTPIYYTGEFDGYTYNNTYIAHAGLDINLNSVSNLFADLQDSLCDGSFALLTNTTLSPIAISQDVVSKIYPERTGFEDVRVSYSLADGSIDDDRRNQTYLVSDTIHQQLIDEGITSGDWNVVSTAIADLSRGDRDYVTMNLTLTGTTEPVPYYVMFDRWNYVSDWVLLVLTPIDNVENAMNVEFSQKQIEISDAKSNEIIERTILLENKGTLDAKIMPRNWPSEWLTIMYPTSIDTPMTLARKEKIELIVSIDTSKLDKGTTLSVISFHVTDDNYADCFYDRDATFDMIVKVNPEVNNNLIGNWTIVGYILMVVVMFVSLSSVVWMALNWNKRIVRQSQPRFLMLLSFGTIVMSSAIIPLGMDDDNSSEQAADRACMATPWLVSMGFIFAFSALFSKIWRINKIFMDSKSFKKIQVTETDVLVPFFTLFGLNFALLLAWTLSDPLRYYRVPVDDDQPFNTYGSCGYADDSGSVGMGLSIGVLLVNFSAVVLACVQAYRAREIGDEFSESKYIGLTIASWLQVFVVGFPVMFLVDENPVATYFLRSALIFIVCMSLLLFIFIPKVLFNRREMKKLATEGRPNNVRVSGLMNTTINKNVGSSEMNFNFSNSSADFASVDMELPAKTTSADSEADDEYDGVNIVRHVHIAGGSRFDQNEISKLRLQVQELTEQNQILCKHILELEQKNFMKRENENASKEKRDELAV